MALASPFGSYGVHTSRITPLTPPDVLATVYTQVRKTSSPKICGALRWRDKAKLLQSRRCLRLATPTHLLIWRSHLLIRRSHLLIRRSHLLIRRSHLLIWRSHLLIRRSHLHLLIRRSHLLIRRSHLLIRRSHLLIRRSHLLIRRSHLLIRRVYLDLCVHRSPLGEGETLRSIAIFKSIYLKAPHRIFPSAVIVLQFVL